ncbi:hypothetical protein JCM11641_006007 [Rhodosporidiobolus odoratus]
MRFTGALFAVLPFLFWSTLIPTFTLAKVGFRNLLRAFGGGAIGIPDTTNRGATLFPLLGEAAAGGSNAAQIAQNVADQLVAIKAKLADATLQKLRPPAAWLLAVFTALLAVRPSSSPGFSLLVAHDILGKG